MVFESRTDVLSGFTNLFKRHETTNCSHDSNINLKTRLPKEVLLSPVCSIKYDLSSLKIGVDICGIAKKEGRVSSNNHGSLQWERFSAVSGDDSAFFCRTNRFTCFGILDGIGSLRMKNIDPAIFPKYIAETSVDICPNYENIISPVQLIEDTYRNSLQSDFYGASTICVAIYDPVLKRLKISNIGDSGFYFIRNGFLVQKSFPKIFSFNFPYQLSNLPKAKISKNLTSAEPSDCDIFDFEVEVGDIIIFYTDGISDNLYENQIVSLTTDWKNEFYDYKLHYPSLSSLLVSNAYQKSYDLSWRSPFAKYAADHNYLYNGGKPDDITALVVSFS